MAGYRQIHTRIWSDQWFMEQSQERKFLFIYLFSNDKASVTGLYELPLRIISFETGLDQEMIKQSLQTFKQAGKVTYDFDSGVVWVLNMLKYQGSSSPKLKKRIEAD